MTITAAAGGRPPGAMPEPVTYRRVLAHHTFRVVFYARVLAIAADTLRGVALSVLVYAETHSALLAAITYGIGFLPQVLGVGIFGALADRMAPRRLIIAGYAIECAAALALALAPVPVWGRLLIVFVIAALTPVFSGAGSRLVAAVLPADEYVLGRSLLSMASSGAQLAGLGVGGVAIAAVGARHALLVCALTYVAATVASFTLPRDDAADTRGAGAATPRPGLFGQTWTRNRAVLADRTLRRLMLTQWLPPAFVTGAESLLVPLAQVRHYPAGAAAWLLACLPAGMVLGEFAVARLAGPARRERLVLPLIGLLGLPLVAFALALPLPVAVPLLGLSGSGFAYGIAITRQFRDAIPEALRGQAFALYGAGLMTLQGVGPVVFGALCEVVAPGPAIAIAGVATLASGLILRDRGGRDQRTGPDQAGLPGAPWLGQPS